MLTRDDVFHLLESSGIRHDDVVTMHTSLRKVGPIEGGADGLIDALKAYLRDGLLLIPTHTWAVVNKEHPSFDVRATVPNIGAMARVAAFREDAVRSLHPTHSLAAFGKHARDYILGEEKSATPAPMGGALSRLYECHGKVLLVGVGHERNTYLHAVDERMGVGNRLATEPFTVTITDWEGHTLQSPPFYHHETLNLPEGVGGLSDLYPNYKKAFEATGAVQYGKLGNAEVYVCDAHQMTDTVMKIWAHADCDVCMRPMDIPENWYME